MDVKSVTMLFREVRLPACYPSCIHDRAHSRKYRHFIVRAYQADLNGDGFITKDELAQLLWRYTSNVEYLPGQRSSTFYDSI